MAGQRRASACLSFRFDPSALRGERFADKSSNTAKRPVGVVVDSVHTIDQKLTLTPLLSLGELTTIDSVSHRQFLGFVFSTNATTGRWRRSRPTARQLGDYGSNDDAAP